MFGKKKNTQDEPQSDVVIGSVSKRRSFRKVLLAAVRSVSMTAKRHIVATVLLGLLLIGAGIFLAIRQQEKPPEPTLTGLDYDATYRKQLIAESGHQADYGDFLILGKQALEQKDYKAAEGYFKDAEKQKADSVDVLYALATVYRSMKNKTLSLEYYGKVIAVASVEDNPYHVNLQIYEAEKRAIESGDFSLQNVVPEGFNAL